MKKYVSIMVIGLMLSMCFIVNPVSSDTINTTSSGTTFYVDDDGTADYTKIQDAIDNATNGDTVFVYNGTYYENVAIDIENISLIGENKETTIIDGGGEDDVVHISADNTVVKEFTIQNVGDMSDSGIVIRSSNNLIIDNIIFNNSNGIFIGDSGKNNNISYNIISSNENAGIVISTDDNDITNNYIHSNKIGLALYSNDNNYITKNKICNNFEGLKFKTASGESSFICYTIYKNDISNNTYGISTIKPVNNVNLFCQNIIKCNNFIDNEKYDFKFINNYFDNNYWDEWIGLEKPFLKFLPYRIPGIPMIQTSPFWLFIFKFNLDWHPASEPYEI